MAVSEAGCVNDEQCEEMLVYNDRSTVLALVRRMVPTVEPQIAFLERSHLNPEEFRTVSSASQFFTLLT